MSNTDKQPQEGDIIGHTNDISHTMQMIAVFLDDVVTHIYGINCQECLWGAEEEGRPAFQFTFDDNNENRSRFSKFLNDFTTLPSSLNKATDAEQRLIAFDSIDDIVPFLEHFSTYRDWGLNVSLENYVSDITSKTKDDLDNYFSNITEPPDGSVMFLRKNAYMSFSECLPELRAAFTAAQNCLPAVKFAYTLDEIRRSLNAFYTKQSTAPYDPQKVLWFH